jgi:hypothetical protein
MKNFTDWLHGYLNVDNYPFGFSKEDVVNWVSSYQSSSKQHIKNCTGKKVPCQECTYIFLNTKYGEYCNEETT